jgi:hypothetical protein
LTISLIENTLGAPREIAKCWIWPLFRGAEFRAARAPRGTATTEIARRSVPRIRTTSPIADMWDALRTLLCCGSGARFNILGKAWQTIAVGG